MGLKDFLRVSSNETYSRNEELLEEYDLLNMFGSPNKLFLKFLNSKGIDITCDEITEDLIEEFEDSREILNRKLEISQNHRQTIFNERKVWINVEIDGETVGTDLLLDHEGITIEETSQKILYSQMDQVQIDEGGWSKKTVRIITDMGRLNFEVNENNAEPLAEILEDNIRHQKYGEIDQLLELHALYDEGKISAEELEARKAVIYSDDVYCTNCGEKLEPDSEFCSSCGERVI